LVSKGGGPQNRLSWERVSLTPGEVCKKMGLSLMNDRSGIVPSETREGKILQTGWTKSASLQANCLARKRKGKLGAGKEGSKRFNSKTGVLI